MKIVCDAKKLAAAMSLAAMACGSRTKPVLNYAKLVANGGNAPRLLATNLEVSVDVSIDQCELPQPGECLLPVDKMMPLLREAHGPVTITSNDRGITYQTKYGRATFGTPPVDEHPAKMLSRRDAGIELPAASLRRMIRLTGFATDEESSRYALGGVRMELTTRAGEGEYMLYVVGTDGRRMAVSQSECKKLGETEWTDAVVPRAVFRLLDRLAEQWADDDQIQISTDLNTIEFDTPDVVINARQVEGRYPNWRSVKPSSDASATLELEVGPYLSAIRQVSVSLDDESRGVDHKLKDGKLHLSGKCQDANGTFAVSIEEIRGEVDEEVTLDFRFVAEALRAFDAQARVLLELRGKSVATTLQSAERDFLYVIMPMCRNE